MKALLIAFSVVMAVASCKDRFRYECQDNRNWNKPQCQRPQCAITGTCPDQLVKPEEMKEDSPK